MGSEQSGAVMAWLQGVVCTNDDDDDHDDDHDHDDHDDNVFQGCS